jgi:putative transcriptional regulator
MPSLRGNLLVASPHLPDPNFFRAVVLIVEHQNDGALGLILNRVSPRRLQEVWETASERPCLSDQYLRVGGPVRGPLMALHSHPELDGQEIVPRVLFSSERRVLEALAGQTEHRFAMFTGYAGWGGGQLEGEMKIGGWLVTPATWQIIFEFDEQTLWQQTVNAIGSEITRDVLRIRDLPEDPQDN